MSNLENLAQLPMNVGIDPALANSIPNPPIVNSSGPSDVAQPQYVTNLTQMLGAITENQIAFQQTVLGYMDSQRATQPPVSKSLGSTVKVRNPCMFNGKHDEVTPFLGEV